MRLKSLLLTCAAVAAASVSSAEEGGWGRALVEANCAGCHAIGNHDASGHSDAPPFRTLSQRYPLEALEEAFAEGISTGHLDMPEFVATPDQIAAILEYIGGLQEP